MPLRAALTLLLLLPAAATAQEIDQAVYALVRISATSNGTTARGTGFVVGLERDKATIVTAAHVIEGVTADHLEVVFAADLSETFSAGGLVRVDQGNPHGLAVFQVRGALPAGVTALSFDGERRPVDGTELFLLGFPQMALSPRTARRVLEGRSGTLLLIDQDVGEGFSGGPVLLGGKVVGVVTETEDQTTYAVNAVVAREALEGWGVKLGGSGQVVARTTPQTRQAPPPPARCVSGQENTVVDGMTFVRICAGTFTMGSAANDQQAYSDEKPAHEVTLSEFWIGKTEVTNEQYRRVRADHQGDAKLPATGVDWPTAQAACAHFGGRLPTEAEWEYAARAGSRTAWSFGDDEKKLGEYAWFEGNSDVTAHPVAMKKANGWGLHDMHGNVWEWVGDWYAADAYASAAKKDPVGAKGGTARVLRGGSFVHSPRFLRSADRSGLESSDRYGIIGFRCVRMSGREP
jgi:formylglycine-generating enzyme required for sulfatase activity